MFNLAPNLVFAYAFKTLRELGKQHGNVEILGFKFVLFLISYV